MFMRPVEKKKDPRFASTWKHEESLPTTVLREYNLIWLIREKGYRGRKRKRRGIVSWKIRGRRKLRTGLLREYNLYDQLEKKKNIRDNST